MARPKKRTSGLCRTVNVRKLASAYADLAIFRVASNSAFRTGVCGS